MAEMDHANLPKLMLISFDGFSWKYLSKLPSSKISHFQNFISSGVHVRWIENVFPTVTRTNHMSLVSGLYAESHGIVHNEFYDEAFDEDVPAAGKLTESDSRWVDSGAEPIWVTNSKAGEGRRSGSILWPCADARIMGMLPDKLVPGEWTVSQKEFTQEQRIDQALAWLGAPEGEAVNFVAVYFTEPDCLGHVYGPDSREVLDAIVECDKAVGYLMDQVEKKGLLGKLNIIITADHGQVAVYPETEINIDRLVDPDWYTPVPDLSISQPMVNIWPKEGCNEKLLAGLRHINLHVETKGSPDLQALHYSNSSRIAPIVIYGEEGWLISNDMSKKKLKGQHGWDPRHSVNMYPFFIAAGPAFKTGVKDGAPFNMVDVYPLMCHVLGLEPSPNDGSLKNVQHILA